MTPFEQEEESFILRRTVLDDRIASLEEELRYVQSVWDYYVTTHIADALAANYTADYIRKAIDRHYDQFDPKSPRIYYK